MLADLQQGPLTHPPRQGFVFLPKTVCEVREVEFARALRLGQSTLEPVAFHVPRVKVGGGDPAMFEVMWEVGDPSQHPLPPQKEYFQDDIYLPTRVWWEPALDGSTWLAGEDREQRRASLRPADMTPGGCRVPGRGPQARGDGRGGVSAVGRSCPAPRRCRCPSERGPQGGSGAEVRPGIRVPGEV